MIILILAFLIIEAIIITALVETTKPGWAFTTVIASIVGYHFLIEHINFLSVLTFIKVNWLFITLSFIGWLIVGVCWALFKWFLFVKRKKKYQDEEKAFADESWTPHKDKRKVKGEWEEFDAVKPEFVYKAPVANKYIDRITTWMLYWPFSMLAYITFEWLGNLTKWIFSKVSGKFDRITASIFK